MTHILTAAEVESAQRWFSGADGLVPQEDLLNALHTIRALRRECGELADKLFGEQYLGSLSEIGERLRALAKGE